jgi:DNA-binding transcriptional regulator LsrR (DeoR family)
MGVASLGKDHTWEINLAARAAWMSYVGDMTQSEIAKLLGVSSARVHRLIQLAKQHGIIRVSIEGRPAECMHLEAEIAASFNLKSCTISPFLSDLQDNQDLSTLSVGQAAGQVLAQHIVLPGTTSLAIDPFGETLAEAVRCIPQISKPGLRVWPTHGCLSRDFLSVTSPVLSTLEQRTKAEIGVLPVPYAPGTPGEYENFCALASVQGTLNSAVSASLFVGQIHPADINDAVTPPDLASEAIAQGAASRFLGTYFDPEGGIVDALDGLIRLPISGLTAANDGHTRRVFALAASAPSKAATLSALRTNLITDLILDEALAEKLVA